MSKDANWFNQEKTCNTQAMAEAAYAKQCEFVGEDHEGHCVALLKQSYDSFEEKITELVRERDEARDERDIFKRTLDKRDKAIEDAVTSPDYSNPESIVRKLREALKDD